LSNHRANPPRRDATRDALSRIACLPAQARALMTWARMVTQSPAMPAETASPPGATPWAVRAWLYVLAALVVAMILVGGATRLTDSGLSITEWQPIAGFIPPLTEAQWLDAFEKYKQIPEYELVNRGMSLAAFKVIYWWEWGHRFLGRIIGIVFVVPFVVFWARRQIPAWLMPRLVLILVLGGLQGALGWYMVMSGLSERVDVSQYRLAAHLGAAFVILGVILWTAYAASGLRPAAASSTGKRSAIVLVALLFLQILAGALVAGLDAGMSHNSWPLMDGSLVPGDMFVMTPWYLNLFENARAVQFDHRVLGYLVWLAAVAHAVRLTRAGAAARNGAILLGILLTLQAISGIWALVAVVPLSLGLLHQFGAAIVFAAALAHLAALSPAARPAPSLAAT
jgi:cytochrome c oxidase assembly protein subunit 15